MVGLLPLIFITYFTLTSIRHELEPKYGHQEEVNYQSGEHEVTFQKGTVLEKYKTKLLISDKGIYLSKPIFTRSGSLFAKPLLIPWRDIEVCVKGGKANDEYSIIYMPIKETEIQLKLNVWEIISPMCQKPIGAGAH